MAFFLSRSALIRSARVIIDKLINASLFYAGWLFCITFAAKGMPWYGIGVSGGMVLAHFGITRTAKEDVILMSCAILAGLGIDSLFLATGLLRYASPNPLFPSLAPLWILMIWALFGISLNHSMWWLKRRYLLAAVLGGWGGAMSYVAGEKLGAAFFLRPYPVVVLVIGATWFVLLPIFVLLAEWLDRQFPTKNSATKV